MMRPLCRLDDIPDGESRGFDPANGGFTGLFAIRRGNTVYAYVNSCPHIGVPLDWTPHRFLTRDRTKILCATPGAEFRIETGECTTGSQPGACRAQSCHSSRGRVLLTRNRAWRTP